MQGCPSYKRLCGIFKKAFVCLFSVYILEKAFSLGLYRPLKYRLARSLRPEFHLSFKPFAMQMKNPKFVCMCMAYKILSSLCQESIPVCPPRCHGHN